MSNKNTITGNEPRLSEPGNLTGQEPEISATHYKMRCTECGDKFFCIPPIGSNPVDTRCNDPWGCGSTQIKSVEFEGEWLTFSNGYLGTSHCPMAEYFPAKQRATEAQEMLDLGVALQDATNHFLYGFSNELRDRLLNGRHIND